MRLFKGFLVSSGVLLATFLLLEFIARCVIFGKGALSYDYVNSWYPLPSSEFVMSRKDAGAPFYVLRPNVTGLFKGSEIQTNSMGFADREFPVTKGPGKYRIAILGDSLAMATGVNLSDTFHKLIENRVREQGREDVEFMNFAVGAYNLDSYYGMLVDKVLQFSPDLVVICWSLPTDVYIYRSKAGPSVPKSPAMKVPLQPVAHAHVRVRQGSFFKLWLKDLLPTLFPRRTNPPNNGKVASAGATSRSMASVETDPDWAYVDEILYDFNRLGKEKKFEMVNVILPQLSKPEDGSFNRYKEVLKDRLGAQRMSSIDVDSEFDSVVPPDPSSRHRYWISWLDEHPNREAHRQYAKILYNRYFKSHFRLEQDF